MDTASQAHNPASSSFEHPAGRLDRSLVRLFEESRVPRYTSYPTAPHFKAGFEPEAYAAWLAEVPPGEPVSLYLHVPYCHSLCWYCGCNMAVAGRRERVERFTDDLLAELRSVEAHLPGRLPVSHLHFGGGTPSILGAAGLERVMTAVRGAFNLGADAEIAIELDPRTVEDGLPAALARLGFNRASLGVQSLDADVQAAINRIQPFERTATLVKGLREAGIDAVSLDLIYGLPRQTVANCLETVERVLALDPERLAIFGYAHVPSFKRHQTLIREDELPGASERVDQLEATAERLREAGYVDIGLDHFAKPDDPMAVALRRGALKRNFQGYTTDAASTLIGLGPSAIGSLPRGYAQNTPDLKAWANAVRAGRLPVAKGLALSAEDKARRAAIERLMCQGSLDLPGMAAELGVPRSMIEPDAARLEELRAAGVASFDGDTVRVPETFRPLLRLVAAAFDRYLQAAPGRHAKAV